MNDNLKKTLEGIIASFMADYADSWETWKHLDAKANGVVAISGVFLSSLFAFHRAVFDKLSLCYQQHLLLAAIWLLAIAILCALISLWIRTTEKRPSSEALETMLKHVLYKNEGDSEEVLTEEVGTDISDEELVRMHFQHIECWRTTIAPINKHLSSKALWVWLGQMMLTGAIILAVMLMTSIFY